jgi:membrane protease YdiL (CAAX protease family)
MFEPPHEDPRLEGPSSGTDDKRESFLDHWTPARWLVFALALLMLYQIAMVVLWNGRGGLGLLGLALAPLLGIALPLWLVLRRFGLSFLDQMQLVMLSRRQFAGVLLSSLGIVPVAYALSVLNARYATPVPEYWDFFKALQPEDAVGFVCGILAVVVFIPLCEELLFRRVVQGVLIRHLSTGVAILLSGFLFGAAHMTPWVLLPISALGVLLALLAHRTQTITAPWLAHLLFNLLSFLELTLTGDPQTQRVEKIAVQPIPVLVGLLMVWWGVRLCGVRRQTRAPDEDPPRPPPWWE